MENDLNQPVANAPAIPQMAEPAPEPQPPVYRLEDLYGTFPQVTTTPTWTPRRLLDSIAFDTSTGKIYYYDFTNKVWKYTTSLPRVVAITSASSYTIDTDTYDALSITALAADINAIDVSGTPSNFQKLLIRIKDNGTTRNITWSGSFASRGASLISATIAGRVHTLGFLYNSVANTWDCVAAVHD